MLKDESGYPSRVLSYVFRFDITHADIINL